MNKDSYQLESIWSLWCGSKFWMKRSLVTRKCFISWKIIKTNESMGAVRPRMIRVVYLSIFVCCIKLVSKRNKYNNRRRESKKEMLKISILTTFPKKIHHLILWGLYSPEDRKYYLHGILSMKICCYIRYNSDGIKKAVGDMQNQELFF